MHSLNNAFISSIKYGILKILQNIYNGHFVSDILSKVWLLFVPEGNFAKSCNTESSILWQMHILKRFLSWFFSAIGTVSILIVSSCTGRHKAKTVAVKSDWIHILSFNSKYSWKLPPTTFQCVGNQMPWFINNCSFAVIFTSWDSYELAHWFWKNIKHVHWMNYSI